MCRAYRSNKLMISAGADKLLKVWDVAAALAANPTGQSSKAVPSLKATAATSAHDKDINAVAVAPNDSLICTASQDRTAKVPSHIVLLVLLLVSGYDLYATQELVSTMQNP